MYRIYCTNYWKLYTTKQESMCICNNSVVYDKDIQGEHKKVAPPWLFLDISAMCEDFCMKFYATVKQSNIHFITKPGWNLFENDKIMLFQPREPPYLSIPSILFTGSLLVSLKIASLLVMRWGCRPADGQSYCRCSQWPPLAATATYAVRHLVGGYFLVFTRYI